MSAQHCPTCTCKAEEPTYPVSCPKCGVTYGRGGEVATHRPGSQNCNERRQHFVVELRIQPGAHP